MNWWAPTVGVFCLLAASATWLRKAVAPRAEAGCTVMTEAMATLSSAGVAPEPVTLTATAAATARAATGAAIRLQRGIPRFAAGDGCVCAPVWVTSCIRYSSRR
jgi:hypothetical protein